MYGNIKNYCYIKYTKNYNLFTRVINKFNCIALERFNDEQLVKYFFQF